jgi:hypothetical protein
MNTFPSFPVNRGGCYCGCCCCRGSGGGGRGSHGDDAVNAVMGGGNSNSFKIIRKCKRESLEGDDSWIRFHWDRVVPVPGTVLKRVVTATTTSNKTKNGRGLHYPLLIRTNYDFLHFSSGDYEMDLVEAFKYFLASIVLFSGPAL